MRRDWMLEHFLLGAVFFVTSTTARSSPSNLFQRASTCEDSSFTQCSQAGLPSNFCCASSTTCIVLAANTTVLCCPSGRDCATIAPITCDVSQQNATLHSSSSLKTTALTSTLATCGSACCPFGYTCNDGVCKKNQDQSTPPPSNSAKSSAAATSTIKSSASSTNAISTVNPTTTSSSQTNGTTTLPIEKDCNKFPVGAVLAGFFPGILLGVLLTVGSVCFLGARRRRAARRRSGSSFGNISEPQPSAYTRTDFLRKPPRTPSTRGSTPTRLGSLYRAKSLFRKSTSTNGTASPVPPIPLNVQKPQRPVTPKLQREPSYEDINIFADGDTASALRERERQGIGRDSHQTTFSDMMERSGLAGLQKGQPYVYRGNSNEQSPPRNLSPRGKEI